MNFKKIGLGLVLFGLVLGMGATLSVRATNELITNGGFESMFNGWDYSGPAIAFNGFSHSGTRYAVLGGLDDCVDNLSQTLTIPTSVDTATLSYWYNITSEEPNTTNAQYDKLKVTIRDLNNNVLDIVDSRSNLNKDSCAVSSCYHKVTYDMKKYSGQTVKVHFYAETDSSKFTYFRIDDVSLIYVQNQLPDLTVDAIQVTPNPPTASGYSDWTVTIRNQSNQNINSPFDLSVYFDNNYVGKAGFSSLGANSTTASTWEKMTWPANTLSHNIKAIVDSSGAVNETNESNNSRTDSFAATQTPVGIGTLYIETTPGEASIYVDSIYKGTSPLIGYLQINNLTAGEHSIKVTKAGYSDWFGNKSVVANSSVYQAVIMSTISVIETCYDGIKNQNETGVDCGGSCTACESIPPTTMPGYFTIEVENVICDTNAHVEPAVQLSWTSSGGATSYHIYRDGILYEDVATDLTFYNSANVTAGHTYVYYVQARNAIGHRNSTAVVVYVPNTICGGAPPASSSPFEIDVNQVYFGSVKLNTNTIINGDLVFGNARATLKNNTASDLNIALHQDDMGFGMTDGNWNVEYYVRIGDTSAATHFHPYETVNLLLPALQVSSLNISIYVKRFSTKIENYRGFLDINGLKVNTLAFRDENSNNNINTPLVLAEWEMNGPVSQLLGTDDNIQSGAQFVSPAIGSKDISICVATTDPDGNSDISGVYADIYNPNQSNIQSTLLKKLSKQDGFDLFCNKIRNNSNSLPFFGYYPYDPNLLLGHISYEALCDDDGYLNKELAYLFCGDVVLQSGAQAGQYKVEISAWDKAGGFSTSESYFAYMSAGSGFCGDRIVGVGEQCDDGNRVNGDGCSSVCQTDLLLLPTVATGSVAYVTNTSVVLSGLVNPNGLPAKAFFTWGETETSQNPIPVPFREIGSGTSPVPVSETITGLQPDTTYTYRLIGVNVNNAVFGNYLKFTTSGEIELPEPYCGDGVVDEGEECDGEEGCTDQCMFIQADNPPVLSFPVSGPYAEDGLDPHPGGVGDTFTFKVIYTDADNDAPNDIFVNLEKVHQKIYMVPDQNASGELADGDYTNGEQYTAQKGGLVQGEYSYTFWAEDKDNGVMFPETGEYPLVVGEALLPDLYVEKGFYIENKDFSLKNSDEYQPNTLQLQVFVRNIGEAAAENVKVNIYINDSLVTSKNMGTIIVSEMEYEIIELKNVPNIDNGIVKIEAILENQQDLNPLNNVARKEFSFYTTNFHYNKDAFDFPNWGLDNWKDYSEEVNNYVYAKYSISDPNILSDIATLVSGRVYSLSGWGGHCYGMSITSIDYFLDENIITYGLSKEEAKPDIIENQWSQILHVLPIIGERIDIYDAQKEYESIVRFMKDSGQPVELGMVEKWDPGISKPGSWIAAGHSVVAYKILDLGADEKLVYIYDSNHEPIDVSAYGERYIIFKPLSNEVIYKDGSQQYDHIYATGSWKDVSEYNLVNDIKAAVGIAAGGLWNEQSWSFRTRSPVTTLITNELGRRIGFVDGVNFINEIPNAKMEKQFESYQFILPLDSIYSIEMTGTNSGILGLDLVTPIDNNQVKIALYEDIPVVINSRTIAKVNPRSLSQQVVSETGNAILPKSDEKFDASSMEVINKSPVASAGKYYQGTEGIANNFDASGSIDVDGSIDLYEWDFNGDGTYEEGSTVPSMTHIYEDDYSGTVGLRVTDDEGLTATDTAEVIVSNVVPIVEAGENMTVQYSDSVQLGGSFTDPGLLDTHTIEWEFGDGKTDEGNLTPIHYYSTPGNYIAVLTVTDNDGGIGQDSLNVIVEKEAVAITVEDQGGSFGDTVILKVIILDDDGQVLSHGPYKASFMVGDKQIGGADIDEDGKAEISWVVDYIPTDLSEVYAISISFGENDYYLAGSGQGSLTVISAKQFKQDSLEKLKTIKTADKQAQKEIDKAIGDIENSLSPDLWIDASHLDQKHGQKVFDDDKQAIKSLLKIIEEKGKNGNPEIAAELQTVVDGLVKADILITKVAISDAEATLSTNTKTQMKIDSEVSKAKEELEKALQELAAGNPDKAIDNLKKSWNSAQSAMSLL